MPPLPGRHVFIVDPMLATGNSSAAALAMLTLALALQGGILAAIAEVLELPEEGARGRLGEIADEVSAAIEEGVADPETVLTVDGSIRAGMKVTMMINGQSYDIDQVGIFSPKPQPVAAPEPVLARRWSVATTWRMPVWGAISCWAISRIESTSGMHARNP